MHTYIYYILYQKTKYSQSSAISRELLNDYIETNSEIRSENDIKLIENSMNTENTSNKIINCTLLKGGKNDWFTKGTKKEFER